jgi:hypothetical protein
MSRSSGPELARPHVCTGGVSPWQCHGRPSARAVTARLCTLHSVQCSCPWMCSPSSGTSSADAAVWLEQLLVEGGGGGAWETRFWFMHAGGTCWLFCFQLAAAGLFRH